MLDARVNSIKAVLAPLDVPTLAVKVSEKVSAFDTRGQGRFIEMDQTKARMTALRSRILDVLRERKQTSAPLIAEELAASGFTDDSPTPLATRVYNDLWRMKQAGVVDNNRGMFSLKEQG
jgi:hypothetical protein